MISDLFQNLEPITAPRVDTGRQSVAPTERVRVTADCHSRSGAPGVESAREKESDLFDYVGKKIVVEEILSHLNGDLKDPRAHRKYLEKLSYRELDARRTQLKEEGQRKLFVERRLRLELQLELALK